MSLLINHEIGHMVHAMISGGARKVSLVREQNAYRLDDDVDILAMEPARVPSYLAAGLASGAMGEHAGRLIGIGTQPGMIPGILHKMWEQGTGWFTPMAQEDIEGFQALVAGMPGGRIAIGRELAGVSHALVLALLKLGPRRIQALNIGARSLAVGESMSLPTSLIRGYFALK